MRFLPRRFSRFDWALAIGVGAFLLTRRKKIDLRGKAVLITGSSRGLGLVLAREFARRGACLFLCARDPVELRHAEAELRASGARVHSLPCDVGDPDQAAELVAEVVRSYGALDVLINNAGIIQVAPEDSMSLADYQAAHSANFWGMVHTTLAALEHMRPRRRGSVVNVTSIGGTVAIPHLLPYSAAKFAAVGFSEGLAAEAIRNGVRVTTVIPGLMRTGSFVNALFKGRRAGEVTWFTLGATLPLVSMSAERAARRIARSCERGVPHLTLGVPAKALRLFHALFPSTTVRVLGAVNRALLPGPGGAGRDDEAEPGWQHRSGLARSFLTILGNRAARKNREVPWAPPVPGSR